MPVIHCTSPSPPPSLKNTVHDFLTPGHVSPPKKPVVVLTCPLRPSKNPPNSSITAVAVILPVPYTTATICVCPQLAKLSHPVPGPRVVMNLGNAAQRIPLF